MEKATKRILSLFDYSGTWSDPYRAAGYAVTQIDKKKSVDILEWDFKQYPRDYFLGVLAAVPCTDYALSGARHFRRKDVDGRKSETCRADAADNSAL